jgi:hypothetical protein
VLVAEERVPAPVLAWGGRSRLPHVVQQRRKPQRHISRWRGVHRLEIVPVHVVRMPVVLIDPEPLEQLRPDVRQHPGRPKNLDPDRRRPRRKELGELLADALRRHRRHVPRRSSHRRLGPVRQHITEPRGELCRPQHPQRILVERRLVDDVDPPEPDILDPAVRIDHLIVHHPARDHVHPEIAPPQIIGQRNLRPGLDRELLVADAGRALPARERDIRVARLMPKLDHRERRPDHIDAPNPL